MRKEVEQLWQLAEPHIAGAGLELVELDFNREAEGWVLRVYIDRPWNENAPVTEDSHGISFDECERVSRDLSAALDVADAITHAYRLEVSSPGIDRPLRTAAHFSHFAGSEAKIQLAVPLHLEGGERKNFKGVLKGVIDDKVEIVCDGHAFQLPIADIDHAKLVPDWDAVMHGKSGAGTANVPKPIKPGHRPSQKPQKQQKPKH